MQLCYNYQMEVHNRQQNKQLEKKIKRFYLGSHERYIQFNSQFDSGNIRVVKQVSDFQYRLQCVDDTDLKGKPVNSKSWFYFQVKGYPKHTKGRFYINKVQALTSIYYSKYAKYYRPVYRVQGSEWKRFENQVEINMSQNGEVQCILQYTFKDQTEAVQFAFCYPYEYSKHLKYLQKIDSFKMDPQIYYHKQVLIKSPQQRSIHLITITSQQPDIAQSEQIFNTLLFPEKKRSIKFKKPVVLLTARVHPGQTPASYAMQGVINFLLDKEDLRAHMLRKMFVFMIVPMINVDGVFHGHFRMDIHGKNLNRFYINPNPQLQPAIFGIKQLAKHLVKDNRLSFYFDFHGHNAKKGCFIYGNAFNDFVEQVESQIFCKLFSMNHSGFQYQYCNFSQKHMNAKDRFQDLTKQGCGRVVMHKTANIIHSYSLQCGIISPNNCDSIPQPYNREFRVNNKGCSIDQIQEPGYGGIKMSDGTTLFCQGSYNNIGKNLLVSILDVFDKNPYNRVYNSRYKTMDMLRRLTAFEIFHSADRFRMFQRSIFGKVKNINLLVQQILSTKLQYKQLYDCLFDNDKQFQEVDWPKNMTGLKSNNYSRHKKYKTFRDTKLQLVDEESNKLSKTDSLKPVAEDNISSDKILKTQMQQQISMDKTSTIQIEGSETGQDDMYFTNKNERSQRQLQKPIKEDEQDQYNSDESEIEETEINQQILLMCQNEKEENELLQKIMHDDFNQKDYQQIEQKYKNKNYPEQEKQTQKNSQTSCIQIQNKNQCKQINKQFSSIKDQKYRLSIHRKISLNTCEVAKKYKKKLNIISGNESVKNNMPVHQQPSIIKKISPAQEFRKNIYDAIKQEIKQGLRREYQRKKITQRMDSKLIDSFRVKNNQRIRANHNYLDPKRLKSKVKLPSLGANMYIITTSTRILQKK